MRRHAKSGLRAATRGGLFGVVLAGAALVQGCSSAPVAPPAPVPKAAPAPTPSVVPSAAPTTTADASASAAPPPAPEPPPKPPVPPPNFAAPYPKTAQDGDGVWEPLVKGPEGQPALLYKAIVHPHPSK
ncbi:MAG: hypothetical protein U0441_33690, partial [Polyangiaceae bacterium]